MLGINTAGYTYPDIQYHEFLFFAIIGIVGGILGALYVRGVVFLNGHRRRMLAPRPKLRVLEAVLLSLAVFSLLFAVPFAFECKECTSAVSCAGGSGSGSGSGLASASGSGSGGSTLRQLGVGFGRQLAGGGTTLAYVRWHCPADTYNPMATLLHSGQEGLIKHMFERSSQQGYESGQDRSLDWDVVLPFLLLYMFLAVQQSNQSLKHQPMPPRDEKAHEPQTSTKGTESLKEVIRIENLGRSFAARPKPVVALSNLNLSMYEGQISCLLGHNGAGKTTTISILTGLFPSSEGDATIYGLSISKDMNKIRKISGVCPQHDLVFEALTCVDSEWQHWSSEPWGAR